MICKIKLNVNILQRLSTIIASRYLCILLDIIYVVYIPNISYIKLHLLYK